MPVETYDRLLAWRRAAEHPFLDEVRAIAPRVAVVGWAPEPPQGAERLAALLASRGDVCGPGAKQAAAP